MIKFYIATLFLLHGLAPAPGVSFGFLIATLSIVYALPSRRFIGARLRLDDGFFFLVFLLGLVPFILEPSRVGMQNLIYSGMWLVIGAVCFWWIRESILAARIEFVEISKAAAVGSILLAIFILSEFILVNTTGLYLSDFVHFSIDEFPIAKIFGDEINRPRGFTAEAGFSAIVFECLLPLSIAWLRGGRLRPWLFCALVIPGYLALFSGATLLMMCVVLLVFLGLIRSWMLAILVGCLVTVLIAVITYTFAEAYWLVDQVIGRKVLEFIAEDEIVSISTFTRPEAYALALKIMTEQPWGIGWGGVSQAKADDFLLFGFELRGSGLISIPLEIGASAGVVGMVLFIVIVWRKLARLVRYDSLESRLTFISLFWVCLHHAVVLEFWFPMIWLSLALADVVAARAKGLVCCICGSGARERSHCLARVYGPA
mgnify:CR=1 FL=1